MPADSRVPHHMPVHSSYPPPGPGYASQQPSHPMPPHHPSRHPSNGPPQQMQPPPPMGMSMGGPPGVHMGGPPPDAGQPPPQRPVSNGHAGTPGPQGPSHAARAGKEKQDSLLSQLAAANENTWMLIGAVSEQMNDQDRALAAFENALRHNPNSILGLNAVASIARGRDNFDKAIEYFQRILNIKQDNGEVWGSMGHCLLMKDDLPKAYTAYQQALHYLPNPKEPKLWYGIGILYDRYGSFEHAEEAFSSVLKMDPNFEKANEIYFRLGIIYKHQRKYSHSLECFRYIINNPPRPLTSWDIWFQLGHVYELDHDFVSARDAYMRVLGHQPDHAKVLQQLGWLYHQPGAPFANQEQAVEYLTKSLETDGTDAQSWYLLGRAFMAGQRYNKAYEAYQQAVYRDGRNPTFWCSIGVLYFQINQYRDALDAYSRAIRLNPYISEVWYNLGSLYESCNNQITDAIDAYSRAAELDPNNASIKQRLQLLHSAGGSNQPIPPPPAPVDVHPSQYSAPPGQYGASGSQPGSPRPPNAQGQPAGGPPHDGPAGRDLPAPPGEYGRGHSPAPFRGGAVPPPLNRVDESRGSMSRHAPLAPIEVERPDPRDMREAYRDGPPAGYNGMAPSRFDPAGDARRHGSPASPRRRAMEAAQPPGPAPYGYQVHPQYRDREREEWERRAQHDARGVMGPPDPRGPSPRPTERGQPVDPRGSLPPGAAERDYPRPPEGYAPYGFDRSAPMPYPPPSYEARRDDRRFEEHDSKPPHDYMNGRQPSREPAPSDMRAPSPAASTSSRASNRRKVSDKPQKDEPAKRAKKADKKDKRVNGDEASPRPSPAPTAPVSLARQVAPPNRSIDEDYDEGAEALMFLHGDRRPEKPTSPIVGVKRQSPPSPDVRGGAKKNKASPPSSATSPTRRTIIEVLNAPSIQSSTKLMRINDKEERRPSSGKLPSQPTSPKDRELLEREQKEHEREQREQEARDSEQRERDAHDREVREREDREREREREEREQREREDREREREREEREQREREDREREQDAEKNRPPTLAKSPAGPKAPLSTSSETSATTGASDKPASPAAAKDDDGDAVMADAEKEDK